MSSDGSRVGDVGELGLTPGLGGSPRRTEVRRLSRDGENVSERGEVRDRRRGEVGGIGGVPGVDGVFEPGAEGWSGMRRAGSSSGDLAMEPSGSVGVGGIEGAPRAVTCLQNRAI